MAGQRLFSEAAERNRGPILEVLRTLLAKDARVFEIASGTGQHGFYVAHNLPSIQWFPSDASPEALTSISVWRNEAQAANLHAPRHLDVCEKPWQLESKFDAIFCANMVHIAPWEASEALFDGAAQNLEKGGLLILYGPYRFGGKFKAESNRAFDQSLRARNPEWGVRDFEKLDALAVEHDLEHQQSITMPSNNHVLVWRAN
ncbi:MAG: DUF938 domain-containing protein [Myxococcales bacterium]|nr:MAG: DUF938 domain-containing protein [Myxococcales bacterium]